MDTFDKDDSTIEIEAAKKDFPDVADVIEDFEMYGKFKVWLDPDNELVNLTDMWRALGREKNRRPTNWLRHEGTKEFIAKLDSSFEVSEKHLKECVQIRRGTKKGGTRGSGGTYVHWQIAMEYARYLDKKFAEWANRVLRERFEEIKRPDVGKKKADRRYVITKVLKQCEKGEITHEEMVEKIIGRIDGMDTSNAFKEALLSRVKGKWPLILMRSKIEKALTGKTVMDQKEEMGLRKNDNYRNYLSSAELSDRATLEKISTIVVEESDEDIDQERLGVALDRIQIPIAGILKRDRKFIDQVSDLGGVMIRDKEHEWKHPSARPRSKFDW